MYVEYSEKKIELYAFDKSEKTLQEIGNEISNFLFFLFFRTWILGLVPRMYYGAISVGPLDPLCTVTFVTHIYVKHV